jgi:hypothetical protein
MISNSQKLEIATQLLAGMLANPQVVRGDADTGEDSQKRLVVVSIRLAEMLIGKCYPDCPLAPMAYPDCSK